MADLRELIAGVIRERQWDEEHSATPGEHADAILAALDAAGLVVVPMEATVAMLVHALPILCDPTPQEIQRGKMAVDAMPRVEDDTRGAAVVIAGQMARDYRVMIAASPYAKKEVE